MMIKKPIREDFENPPCSIKFNDSFAEFVKKWRNLRHFNPKKNPSAESAGLCRWAETEPLRLRFAFAHSSIKRLSCAKVDADLAARLV